jgi:hypothetical protein
MVHYEDRRKRQRRFAFATILSFLVVGLSVITALWRQSVEETRRAEASELLALGQLELESDPTAAVAYALKSLELADAPEARLFALEVLQQGPVATSMTIQKSTGEGLERAVAHFMDFTPDGEWLAIGGFEFAQLRPQNGGAPVLAGQFPSAFEGIEVHFSPEGDRLVMHKGGEVRFWSVRERRELGRRSIGPSTKTWLLMAGKGPYTYTKEGDEAVVRAWSLDREEPQVVGRMEVFRDGDFDSEGRWLVYAKDRQIFLRSISDWDSPPRLVGEHSSLILDIRFHPSGGSVASLDVTGEIRLWPVVPGSKETVRVIQPGDLPAPTGGVTTVNISCQDQPTGRFACGLSRAASAVESCSGRGWFFPRSTSIPRGEGSSSQALLGARSSSYLWKGVLPRSSRDSPTTRMFDQWPLDLEAASPSRLREEVRRRKSSSGCGTSSRERSASLGPLRMPVTVSRVVMPACTSCWTVDSSRPQKVVYVYGIFKRAPRNCCQKRSRLVLQP